MERVGSYLRQEAVRLLPQAEADLFGRTAFNRFYYATYLEVRSGLSKMKAEWTGEMPHAMIPEILRGTVKKELTKGRAKALKADDHQLAAQCASAASAAMDLAKLLDEGRQVRVTADYYPEVLVNFARAPDFELNSVAVLSASSWPYRARVFMQVISGVWRQVYVW
ncbi:hypothetical protein LXT12_00840 [Pelomonas sp. P7]|uniref:HEPN domain-containing protein n=1 Tax=Pelomonas caseinilytica TaxID=2906763 RepID=A0ABS8X8N3_9BURK|nr:hypothetical protein [Pelomonas sp. P7]MCE4535805.1 hypothetical protein [Pelomonas sp. P7]